MRQEASENAVIVKYNQRASEAPTEIKAFNLIAKEASLLDFSNDKIQTVTYVWLSPKNGEDFSRYQIGMRPLTKRLGVIKQARFETTNSDYQAYPNRNETPPDLVTFMEWPSL